MLAPKEPKESKTMKRFQIYLPPDRVDRIKAIANGRSVAEVIRMAVDEFLTKYDKAEPR